MISLENLVIIHIGKCGGSSVINALKKQFNCRHICNIHIQKVNFEPNKKYLILIRNPISRFISAFNWRKYLVLQTKKQYNRFESKREAEILKKYKKVNDIAEDIINLDFSKYYIHHINEDISFYLEEFLSRENVKDSIIGVVCQETIKEDIKRLFDFTINLNLKKSLTSDKYLSEIGIQNLKTFLKKDYECIQKLYDMKLISEKQYMCTYK